MKLYMLGLPLLLIFSMAADDCYAAALDYEKSTATSSLDGIEYAASTSKQALEALDAAARLRNEAIKRSNLEKGNSMSMDEIDAAIAKVPGQGSFYLDKAAMLVMQGRSADAQTNLAKARGIYEDAYAAAPAGDGTNTYRSQYIIALTRARNNVRPGSVQEKKLDDEMCAQWKAAPATKDYDKGLPIPAKVKCR